MIGLVPTAFAVCAVSLMIVGKAPGEPLTLANVTNVVTTFGVAGGFLLLFFSAAISITLQPLQYRLVQFLEGYWTGRLLAAPFRIGVWRQRRRHDRYARRLSRVPARTLVGSRLRQERARVAHAALLERFPAKEHVLPTALGNVLRAMEEQAGARYRIEAIPIWRRLYPVLPAQHAQGLENEVIQLDVSSRLTVTWFVAGLIGAAILARDADACREHPGWVLLVLLMFLAAWASYRAALESALAHASDVEVTLDLYRDCLIDAARLPRARTLAQECEQFELLVELFTARTPDHGVDYRLRRRRNTEPRPDSPG